jgi:hypothetical protein
MLQIDFQLLESYGMLDTKHVLEKIEGLNINCFINSRHKEFFKWICKCLEATGTFLDLLSSHFVGNMEYNPIYPV